MKRLLLILAIVLAYSPIQARILTSPDNNTIELLQRFLSSTPPDFEDMARNSDEARNASEFERAGAIKRETDRLRQEYLSMQDVDMLVFRVRSTLGEYDGNEGGFLFDVFEPNSYIPFGRARLTFDNYTEFSHWKLPVAEAKAVLPQLGPYSRNIVLEVHARPITIGYGGDTVLRTQVRSVRVLTEKGKVLAEIKSSAPENEIKRPGNANTAMIPDDKLDFLGLKVGQTPEEFEAWAKKNNLVADELEGQQMFTGDKFVRSVLRFTARRDGFPKLQDTQRLDFLPLEIARKELDCGAEIDSERLCGLVTVADEHGTRRINSIRVVQTIVGLTDEQIITRLSEKYGSYSDRFDTTIKTGFVSGQERYRSNQYVWGNPMPRDDKRNNTTSFTDQQKNWQIEAVLSQPQVNRSVLMLQLIGAPGGATAGSGGNVKL